LPELQSLEIGHQVLGLSPEEVGLNAKSGSKNKDKLPRGEVYEL
jgi:hypothetical protein